MRFRRYFIANHRICPSVAILLIMLSIRNTTVHKLMKAMQAADEAPAHEK